MPIASRADDAACSAAWPQAVERESLGWFALSMVIASLLWLATDWTLAGRHVELKARQAAAETERTAAQDAAEIAARVERSLSLLHGLAAVVARDQVVRRALTAPTPRASDETKALTEWLAASATEAGYVGVLWIMNAEGDCIASSNGRTEESFVGQSYAAREYFHAARLGRRAFQFAAWRPRDVAKFHVSVPVLDDGHFLGAIAVEADLRSLEIGRNHASVLVADATGVVVLASDDGLELRALSGAAVSRLGPAERRERYGSEAIREISVSAWEGLPVGGLLRVDQGDTPLLLASRSLGEDGLSVTVMRPVPALVTMTWDRLRLFALGGSMGMLVIAGVASASYHAREVLRARRRRESQRQIEYLASHDSLTGLFSRAMADPIIGHGIALAARGGHSLAVLFMDLDLFKTINDSMGHEAGDLVLQEVARRLRASVRASDAVIRNGGDEFIVVLSEVEDVDGAALVAKKILEAMRQPLVAKDVVLELSASLGIAIYPRDGDSAALLLRNADAALYRTKENGRGHYRFFRASMNAESMAHQTMAAELRRALIESQFVLRYEPQYSLSRDRVIGCDASPCWLHPTRGPLSVGEFLPAMERAGLSGQLGEWTLREACRQAQVWRRSGVMDFPMAVTVSAAQFRQPSLLDSVEQALAAAELPPEALELGVPESALLANPTYAEYVAQGIRALGVGFTVVAFGSACSGLAQLRRLAPDALRVDPAVMPDLEVDANTVAIVRAMIELGRGCRCRVIAEGIETQSQLRRVEALGCSEVQGSWFGGPMTAAAFATFVSRYR